jgi:hypothetical protein
MPVEYFIRYQGKRYDVGTRLKFKAGSWSGIMEGKIEWISHNVFGIRLTDGTGWQLSHRQSLENTIVEIIEPVYYEEPPMEYVRGLRGGGPLPPEDAIFVGWVWYIAIMVVGVIFKDRLMIWVFASAVFFLWKNGFLNGGNK